MSDQLPPRFTTPLLTLITQQSLDEDYLQVAGRRAFSGEAPSRRVPIGAAVVLAVFGVIVMTAVIQTSRNADTEAADRATLIARINESRATVADLQKGIQTRRQQITAATSALDDITDTVVAEQTEVRRLQIRTGYIAVQGPGVRITVDDPPDVDNQTDLVQAGDLRRLVNGLWQSGAEAIAINSQRLTVLSAIRNSGPVINVNYQPVRAPYVVSVIGNPRTLQADLLASEGGLEFAGLVKRYGFGFQMQNVDGDQGLSLPAAPVRQLRSARPLDAAPSRPDLEELTP